MCPLWNRASSLASSGGISSRTGSGTEEIYSNQSTPAQTSTASSSSGNGGWLSKAWNKTKDFFSNHSEGSGKVLGTVSDIAAMGIDAYLTSKGHVPVATPALKLAKETIATIGDNNKGSKLEKFTNALTNKRIDDTTSKAYDIYNNKDLSKVAKLNEYSKLINEYRTEEKKNRSIATKPTLSLVNPVSNVSNGHVPTGYQASSSQGSMGLRKAIDKFEKKANKANKANKAKKVWNDWKKKQNNKKKTKQNKHK